MGKISFSYVQTLPFNDEWYEARDQRPPSVVGRSIVRAPFGVIAPSAITHSVVTLLTVSIFISVEFGQTIVGAPFADDIML